MAKPKKYDKLFDKEINGIFPQSKERFLETINSGTRDTYRYVLSVAYSLESILNKDIYEMSWEELDGLIRMYSNRDIQSVHANVSCLRRYIAYCINELHLVPDMINYLDGISGEENLQKYIDKRAAENRYLSREELITLQSQLANPRDALILELLFQGVKGRNTMEDAFEELINLKVTDCNFEDNAIIVTRNDGSTRTISDLPEYTMNLITDTINAEEYVKNNGFDYNAKTGNPVIIKHPEIEINKTPFVLRVAGKNKFDKMDRSNITVAVSNIKKWSDNPYLTPTNIWMSGLIHYAKQIKVERGDLTKEDYLRLHERYGIENNEDRTTNKNKKVNETWMSTRRKIKDYI